MHVCGDPYVRGLCYQDLASTHRDAHPWGILKEKTLGSVVMFNNVN